MKRTIAWLAMAGFIFTSANAQQTDYKPMDDVNKVVDLTLDSLEKVKTARPAAGSSRKAPPIRGLKDYEGKGVSYCAVCDAFFYRNLPVAVVGSEEYAASEASHLLPIASEVTILTNGGTLNAALPEGAGINEKMIRSISGSDNGLLSTVIFEDGSTLNVEGLFIAEGTASSTDLARKLGVVTPEGKIETDENMATFIPGFFTAGDCNGGLLQVAKAVCDGALAGTSAVKYLRNRNS